jgi:hypothetical protein
MFTNLLLALGVIAGLACIAVGLNALRVGLRSRSWLPTPGKILTSRVGPAPEESFRASVTYRYSFGGAEFESSRIRPLESYASFRGPAQRVVDRYQPTQQVIVFVNPARPEEAFLEPGVQRGSSLLLILSGLGMAAVAGYKLFVALGVIEGSGAT